VGKHKYLLCVSGVLDSITGHVRVVDTGELMTTGDPGITLIQAAVQQDAASFAAKMANSSLEAAVDIWLRRVERRKVTPAQRTRLVKRVGRGDAAETKAVQLTRAALLRAAGLDDRPAAAAAVAAGATYTEIGAVLGVSQQWVSARMRSYQADAKPQGATP
jgi:hypothetical protein